MFGQYVIECQLIVLYLLYSLLYLDKYSLNYSEFVRNRDSIVKISKKFDKIGNYRSDLTIDWIEEDRLEIDVNNSFKEKRARWKETLIKDIQLNEAINILSDIVQKQKAPILASSR